MTTHLIRIFRALALAIALVGGALEAAPAGAQPKPVTTALGDTLREFRLADGSVVFGRVEGEEDGRITIVTQNGTRVQVERSQIRSDRPIRGTVREGRVWRDDPAGTRLFFAPTGRNLRAGEGYFGVYELFFPFTTYAVTDRFTIAAGTPIIPEAIGELAYVAPKVALVQSERLNVGAGVFAGFFEGETAGIAYGVATFGDRDNALTAGAGMGFADGELASDVLVLLGGEARLGRQTKLITENYLFTGESGMLLSGGIRFFGERLSADAGIGGFIGSGETGCCLPLVNFVYTFGKR